MFLRFSVFACIVALASNASVSCSNLSAQTTRDDKVVIGEGRYQFEIQKDWGLLPKGNSTGTEKQQNPDGQMEGRPLGPTHGSVCVDENGTVYVALDRGENGLAVFNSDGEFLRFQAKGLSGLHHLIYRKEGKQEFLYAAHLAGKQVVKLSTDGKVVWKIGCPMQSGKYQKPSQYRPTGIAVSKDGSVFVADGYGKNWIHKFDKNQKYVMSFGGLGTKEGQFRTCHSVAVDNRDGTEKLLVCDRENRRLQFFDLKGKFLSVSTTDLFRPCCLAFHKDKVAVAELSGRVTLLDKNNKVVAVLGDNQKNSRRANYTILPKDWSEDQFNAPHGLTFTNDGNLIILEWNKIGRLMYLKSVPKL